MTRLTSQVPNGRLPSWYPGTNAIRPADMALTQWAAVMSRSPCGLSTTPAVQKCPPRRPAESLKSAPTAGVPSKKRPPGSDGGAAGALRVADETASVSRTASLAAPWPAGVPASSPSAVAPSTMASALPPAVTTPSSRGSPAARLRNQDSHPGPAPA
jgi:hypothetical protein